MAKKIKTGVGSDWKNLCPRANNVVELQKEPYFSDRIWLTTTNYDNKLIGRYLPGDNIVVWATKKCIRIGFITTDRITIVYKLRLDKLSDEETYIEEQLVKVPMQYDQAVFSFVDTNDLELLTLDLREAFTGTKDFTIHSEDGFIQLLHRKSDLKASIGWASAIDVFVDEDSKITKRSDPAYQQLNFITTMIYLTNPELSIHRYTGAPSHTVRRSAEIRFSTACDTMLKEVRKTIHDARIVIDDVQFAVGMFDSNTYPSKYTAPHYIDDDYLPF